MKHRTGATLPIYPPEVRIERLLGLVNALYRLNWMASCVRRTLGVNGRPVLESCSGSQSERIRVSWSEQLAHGKRGGSPCLIDEVTLQAVRHDAVSISRALTRVQQVRDLQLELQLPGPGLVG